MQYVGESWGPPGSGPLLRDANVLRASGISGRAVGAAGSCGVGFGGTAWGTPGQLRSAGSTTAV